MKIIEFLETLVVIAAGIVIYLNAIWMEFTGFWLWFSIISGTVAIVAGISLVYRIIRW